MPWSSNVTVPSLELVLVLFVKSRLNASDMMSLCVELNDRARASGFLSISIDDSFSDPIAKPAKGDIGQVKFRCRAWVNCSRRCSKGYSLSLACCSAETPVERRCSRLVILNSACQFRGGAQRHHRFLQGALCIAFNGDLYFLFTI